MPTRFENRINRHSADSHPPTVRKVPADSVPFGSDISLNGRTVWIALDGDRVIAVAATSAEVRVKYREALRREQQEYLKC
jgi:hypothetical protein